MESCLFVSFALGELRSDSDKAGDLSKKGLLVKFIGLHRSPMKVSLFV